MIKLKNLWKIALATMAMSAMLIACDDPKKTEEEGIEAGIYLSGLNSEWAGDTDPASTPKMTEGENEIYTLKFKAESAKPFPFGFKLTTENGWMEQYIAYNKDKPTTDFTVIEANKEYDTYFATKAMLEEKDEETGKAKIADEATKWNMDQLKICTVGEEYIVTFDKKNMKIKLAGNFKDVELKTITVTIFIGDDDAKLILKDVPTYNVDSIATIDGSLFSWAGGKTAELMSADCEVTASWTGADANTWVAEQAPKDSLPEGADAWAKLAFSANSSEGWVPYSSTDEFTYSWNDKK